MKILAFEDLKLERLYTETYSIRPEYISVLENSGFECEGVLKNHIRIKNQPLNSFIHGCVKK
jgi:RimJ/RimL family protein N-acetyltransferase